MPKKNLVEEIPNAINDVAVMVTKLRLRVDPGHVQMIQYLRRFNMKLDRLKNDFRARCEVESGGR